MPDSTILESGIRVPEKKDFIEQFTRIYLETHPEYGKQKPIPEALVKKWVIGIYRSMFVSNIWDT